MPAKYMTETVNQLDPIRDSTQLNAIEIVYYSYIRNNKIEQILFIRIVYHSAHVDQW